MRPGVGGGLLVACSTSVVGRERWALLLAKCHFPDGSQVNSKKYFFLTMTCPPVALAAPENIFRPFWASLAVSYVGIFGKGAA